MKVVVADSQVAVRGALSALLTYVLGMQVVGTASSSDDLWTQVVMTEPDVLVVDWGLLGTTACAAMTHLHATFPDIAVLILNGHPEIRVTALAAGATAFVSKGDSPDHLIATLREIDAQRHQHSMRSP